MSRGSKKTIQRKSILTTNDANDFEKSVQNLEKLEESSRKIYKDVKLLTDSNISLGKSLKKLSQDYAAIDSFPKDFKPDITRWNNANSQIEQNLSELNVVYIKTLSEPMKRLNKLCPSMQECVKKREQLLQECHVKLQKVDKYQSKDRTGANLVKLEEAAKIYKSSMSDFKYANGLLVEKIPQFYDLRVQYIQPCLTTAINSQISHTLKSYESYCEISDLMDCVDLYRDNISDKLSCIKALSITADD